MNTAIQSLTNNELSLATKLAQTELALLNSELARIQLAGPQTESKVRVLMIEQERRSAEPAPAPVAAEPVAEPKVIIINDM